MLISFGNFSLILKEKDPFKCQGIFKTNTILKFKYLPCLNYLDTIQVWEEHFLVQKHLPRSRNDYPTILSEHYNWSPELMCSALIDLTNQNIWVRYMWENNSTKFQKENFDFSSTVLNPCK